jgi:hypothetical protein
VSLSSVGFEGWAHRMGRSASVHTQIELVCVVACHPRLGHVTWVLCHLSVAISVWARVHLNVSQRARPRLVLTSCQRRGREGLLRWPCPFDMFKMRVCLLFSHQLVLLASSSWSEPCMLDRYIHSPPRVSSPCTDDPGKPQASLIVS